MKQRLPNTDEDQGDQSLTLVTTGTPVLERKPKSVFPGFKTLGSRKVTRRERKRGR